MAFMKKKEIKKLIEKYEMIIGYTANRLEVDEDWIAIKGTEQEKLIKAQLEDKIHTLELVIKDLKMLL